PEARAKSGGRLRQKESSDAGRTAAVRLRRRVAAAPSGRAPLAARSRIEVEGRRQGGCRRRELAPEIKNARGIRAFLSAAGGQWLAVMFPTFTTFFPWATSCLTASRKRSGGASTGSTPSLASRAWMSGSFSTLRTSVFHRVTIAFGRPFGPQKPYHSTAS